MKIDPTDSFKFFSSCFANPEIQEDFVPFGQIPLISGYCGIFKN